MQRFGENDGFFTKLNFYNALCTSSLTVSRLWRRYKTEEDSRRKKKKRHFIVAVIFYLISFAKKSAFQLSLFDVEMQCAWSLHSQWKCGFCDFEVLTKNYIYIHIYHNIILLTSLHSLGIVNSINNSNVVCPAWVTDHFTSKCKKQQLHFYRFNSIFSVQFVECRIGSNRKIVMEPCIV